MKGASSLWKPAGAALKLGLLVLVPLALVKALAGRAVAQIPEAALGVDDANIFFVFARNLAHGHGFVFNLGGERVEGFSSPLWTLVCAAFYRLTETPETLLLLFNIAVVGAALAAAGLHLTRRPGLPAVDGPLFDPLLLPVGLLLTWTAAAPAFVCWTTVTLMETGLWSALLLLTPLLVARAAGASPRSRWADALLNVCLVLLLLGRPEGFLLAGVAAAVHALLVLLSGASWKRCLGPFGVFFGTAAGLTLLRLLYFGHPLPNTYYAKISPDEWANLRAGWEYFTAFLESNRLIAPLLGLTFLLAVSALGSILWRRRRPVVPPVDAAAVGIVSFSAFALAGALVPILVGGDHFGAFRFYQPVWPLLILPACQALAWGLSKLRRPWLATAAAVILVPPLFLIPASNRIDWNHVQDLHISHEFALAKEGRLFGAQLNRLFPSAPRPRVGAVAVGGIAYAYQGWIVDLMGLCNTEMAHHIGSREGPKNHAAFSKEVFYRQKPEMVMLGTREGPLPEPLSRDTRDIALILANRWVIQPVRGIYHDAEFRALYTLAFARRQGDTTSAWVLAFFRDDYLAALRGAGLTEVVPVDSK